jgi:predicted MFS family arabinose efflux permease
VLILFTVGGLCLALFVVIELEVDQPMLNVRVFKYWAFTNSLILIGVLSVGLFGVLFFIPLFLQQTQGLGAFDTGLLLLPQALVMGVLMPVAGRIYDRFGPRWPAVIGLSILTIGTWMLRDLSVTSSWTDLRWILMFRAIGMGLAMMPIMTGGISAVPPDQVSGASAFNNVTQRTAAAMGLAALTALLGSRQAQQLADTGGMMGLTTGGTSGAGASTAAAAASGASAAPGASGGMSPMLEHYMTYTQAQASAFTTALDNLMIVTSVLTAIGVVLALFLRNGPAPKTGGPAVVEA